MTFFSSSNTPHETAFSQLQQSTDFETFNENIYEFQELEENFCSKVCGFQKPKHRWMAKDQSVIFPNVHNTVGQSAPRCMEVVRETDDVVNFPENLSLSTCVYTPLQNCCSSLSPSTSSSAPGTVVMPSSLTNTSSSPSNHTPLHNRSSTNLIYDGNRCISPNSSESMQHCSRPLIMENEFYQSSVSASTISLVGNVLPKKGKQKRQCKSKSLARPAKPTVKRTKKIKSLKIKLPLLAERTFKQTLPVLITKTKKQRESNLDYFFDPKSAHSPVNVIHSVSESTDNTDSPVVGGLKIRLRRDNNLPEPPTCGKKSRIRKSKESSVFRIVESWCDADAPGGEFTQRTFAAAQPYICSSSFSNQPSGSFRVGDLVWAKLAGYPYWPSQISALRARTAHQLNEALVLPNQSDPSSLTVIETPSDPALAPGFIAKVDWLACDQCSYVSCSKIYPFLEYFEKFYNPRTRVKGYAEAVKMAKNQPRTGVVETDTDAPSRRFLPSPHDLVSYTEAPSSSAVSKSTFTSLPSSEHYSEHFSTEHNHDIVNFSNNNCPLDLSLPFSSIQSTSLSIETTVNQQSPFDLITLPNNFGALNSSSFPDVGTCQLPPLPQLDISGFADIVSHVPTFSEDEDDADESIASQLKIHISSIT